MKAEFRETKRNLLERIREAQANFQLWFLVNNQPEQDNFIIIYEGRFQLWIEVMVE